MGYFSSPEEVDKYIGEMFRQANDHPKVGPKMRAANVVMRVVYTDAQGKERRARNEPASLAEEGEARATLDPPALGDCRDKLSAPGTAQ